jgi:iron complex outermembrane receptor protein
VNDRLEALAGLRVTRSVLDLSVLSEGPYAGGAITVPAERRQRETPITPKFGVSYRGSPGRLIYASVSKGFRIGGANPPVPSGPCAADLAALGRTEAPVAFGSDSLWSYEAGIKSAVDRGRINVSLSAFQIDWKGIQQPLTLPNCGFSFTDNLGAARSRGFEFEGEARPFPGISLTTSVGFVDARFRKTVETGGEDGDGAPAVLATRGDRIPYVPRWTMRMAGRYDLALPDGIRGFLRAEYQYVGAYRRAPFETAIGYDARVYRGDSFATAMLRAGIEKDRWSASVFVENLLDDRSILFSSVDFVPVTGSPLRHRTLSPRSLGVYGQFHF